MYYVYRVPRPSLLIESIDSMIAKRQSSLIAFQIEVWFCVYSDQQPISGSCRQRCDFVYSDRRPVFESSRQRCDFVYSDQQPVFWSCREGFVYSDPQPVSGLVGRILCTLTGNLFWGLCRQRCGCVYSDR